MLSERVGCPVVLCTTQPRRYAELKAGAGRGARHLLFITVSTGIGGALFIDGDLYDGATGSAVRWATHRSATTGRRAARASRVPRGTSSGPDRDSHARRARSGHRSSLQGVDPATIDARAIVTAANAGDALALQVFNDAGHALGRAIGGSSTCSLPMSSSSRGLIHAGDLLLKPARLAATQIAFEIPTAAARSSPLHSAPTRA